MSANNNLQRDEMRRLIGRRIRRRRLFLKMSQAALARGLGITFQQVQKYENGKNATPEARLREIARQLDVTPDYFTVSEAGAAAEALDSFVQSPDGLALYRAISALPDGATRAQLIMAIAVFCDSQARPEDKEAQTLAAWLQDIVNRPGTHKKAATASIHAMKVELARRIGNTLKARKLTQTSAAKILFADQARISALARGDVRGSSFEKLLRYLLLLGWNADLRLARRPVHAKGKIAVIASDS